MKRFLPLAFLITSAILLFADAERSFAQVRPNRQIKQEKKQERIVLQQQQRMQQGDIPPRLRNRFPPAKQRPGGALPGLAPANPNKPLTPQQREIRRQLIDALGLTPEQRFKIADIHKAHEDEAITIGRRLRQSRRNLDLALWSENYNEALVKQYSEELAQAQADQIRLQSRVNSEIRSAINPEQIRRFRLKERELEMQRREEIQRGLQQQNQPPDDSPPIKKPPNGFDEDELLFLLLR